MRGASQKGLNYGILYPTPTDPLLQMTTLGAPPTPQRLCRGRARRDLSMSNGFCRRPDSS